MGITLIAVGIFFLFNPFINIVDILPDFIGYILILLSTSKLSRLNAPFARSNKYFLYLLYTASAKIAVLLLLSLSKTDAVMLLLMSFVFGGFEISFGIPAFNNLFDGFSESAIDFYYDKDAAHSRSATIDAVCSSAKSFTAFFIIARSVLSVLPELASLSSDQYGDVTNEGIVNIARFLSIFRTVAFVFGLAIGIIWLIKTARSLKKIAADKAYTANILQKYKEYFLADEKKVFTSRMSFFFIFSSVALILSFRFVVDGINLIPDFISGAFFAVAFVFAQKIFKSGAFSRICSVLYIVFSTAYWIDLFVFADRYHDSEAGSGFADDVAVALERSFDAIYHFASICILAFICSVLFFLVINRLFRYAKKIINDHTGEPDSTKGALILDEKMLKDPLKKQLKLAEATGYISCLTSFIQIVTSTVFPSFYWLIDLPVRLIFVVISYSLFGKLKKEFEKKYSR